MADPTPSADAGELERLTETILTRLDKDSSGLGPGARRFHLSYQAADALRRLSADNARLTAERDEARASHNHHRGKAKIAKTVRNHALNSVANLLARAEAAEATVARLTKEGERVRAALRSSRCPAPLTGDGTVGACVDGLTCGCDNGRALTPKASP